MGSIANRCQWSPIGSWYAARAEPPSASIAAASVLTAAGTFPFFGEIDNSDILWSARRRWRHRICRDDMKAHGHLVAGENRAEQHSWNIDAELLVVEFYFAVACEAAVWVEDPMHRDGHRTFFAVQSQRPNHYRGAFVRSGRHNSNHAFTFKCNGRKFIRLERLSGDGSIARRTVTAIAGRVDDDPDLSGALGIRGIATYFAVDYPKRPCCIAADHRRWLCNSRANGTLIGIDFLG